MKTREEIQEFVMGKLAKSALTTGFGVAKEVGKDLLATGAVNLAGLGGDQIRQGLNLYGGRARMGGQYSAAGQKDRRLAAKRNVDRQIVDPIIGTQKSPGIVQLGIARGIDKYNELQLANVSDKIKKIKAMEAEPSKRSEKENEELTAERKRLEKKQDKFGRRLGIRESAGGGEKYGEYSYFEKKNPRDTVGKRLIARYGRARQLDPDFTSVPLSDLEKAKAQERREQRAEQETVAAADTKFDVASALSALRKRGKSIKTLIPIDKK
jgi:hypothetical protein